MTLLSEIRSRIRYIFWPTIWATLILYFTFHILQGERGLIAYWQINSEVSDAKAIRNSLLKEKTVLQNRVNLLSPKSLDPDMLEERVRVMLGYSKPNETIIILK